MPMTGNNVSHAALRLPQVTALYVGAVLGSGILIIPGIVAEAAGPASLVAWAIMAVLVIPMALTMGLLSARYPNAGGVAHFVSLAFNPCLGSLIGWFFLMSVVIGAPVLALTGAGYICAAFGLGDTSRLVLAAVILAAGLAINHLGIRVAGGVQSAVVMAILIVLAVTIGGGVARTEPAQFSPFMPRGWQSIGYAATIIFWCFIGWEAVSHLADEFKDPAKTAVQGTLIAIVVVDIAYLATAFVVVGTGSYGPGVSDVSLMRIIKTTLGESGARIGGITALSVCMAPAIAYIGAAARLAAALARGGYAPHFLARTSPRRGTPSGSLAFLCGCFMILLALFSTRRVSMATLIQIPTATFILTYLGGCAAGLRLLKDSRLGFTVSLVSLVMSAMILVFVKWTILYAVAIAIVWLFFTLKTARNERKRPTSKRRGFCCCPGGTCQ